MFGFVFVQKQDVNKESLKHGEINSYVVYVYDIHFPRHLPKYSQLQRKKALVDACSCSCSSTSPAKMY